MGKLADRLREIARGGVRPIGFASKAAPVSSPRMLTVALLDAAEAQAVSESVQAGADAVLVPVGSATGDGALKSVGTAGRRAMWGGVLAMGGKEDVERLERAGCDFVVLASGTIGADALVPENIDQLLEIDPAWDDLLVRGVEQLPVTAVLFRLVTAETLTIQHLLQCQRIVWLTRKPVLTVLPSTVGPESLPLLRDIGISGVVVPPPAVKDFRTAIRELPAQKRRQDRDDAVLSSVTHGFHQEAEEEEEEN